MTNYPSSGGNFLGKLLAFIGLLSSLVHAYMVALWLGAVRSGYVPNLKYVFENTHFHFVPQSGHKLGLQTVSHKR